MDLFNNLANHTKDQPKKTPTYTAHDIEVLEGLEPVRRRPGMYIGGKDESAMLHLVSEVLDNSMDEAVAGYANKITIHLSNNNAVSISDNGRGIPIDKHPKFPDKSALEVILTTLHSGGKFDNKVYSTSGGLHGVGVSVVNALSEKLTVQVRRNNKCYQQEYSKGVALGNLTEIKGKISTTGTLISFIPDQEIFGDHKYTPDKIYRLACSKAYLYKGMEIHWSCDKELIEGSSIPPSAIIHFPNGLKDFLNSVVDPTSLATEETFFGEAELFEGKGKIEWAVNWIIKGDAINRSYCNTIYTSLGGTHENGLRAGLLKGLKNYAELIGNKKAAQITVEDIASVAITLVSIFIPNPIFQGQTKEKLLSQEVSKPVEQVIRNHFEHWLTATPKIADGVLELLIEESEDRQKRRKSKEVARKNPIKSLRLPGKLTDCSREDAKGTELFLVEGDSAGGSAKQARDREIQAILPLKGKILNVASSSLDKIQLNQEINDLIKALGCSVGSQYREQDLRYDRVIIMTDADVDGAHITSLLLTFFYRQLPQLIKDGHLYLAQPPLFKITQGANNHYVQTDEEKNAIVEKLSKGRGNIEVSRFKGLGEMAPHQLKETTMDPKKRTLFKVMVAEDSVEGTNKLVEDLMGKNPEPRFRFIKLKTESSNSNLKDLLDV